MPIETIVDMARQGVIILAKQGFGMAILQLTGCRRCPVSSKRTVAQTEIALSHSLRRFLSMDLGEATGGGLEQAVDLSTNGSEEAKRNLGNSP